MVGTPIQVVLSVFPIHQLLQTSLGKCRGVKLSSASRLLFALSS